MDQNRYKQTETQRGLTYSYYWLPPASGKPVLFFAHGFPSASFLWRRQVPFFEQLGYGIVVPDMLGYGGTDKPTDPKVYNGSGLAQDIVDIFDAEGLGHVIAVGHDWGSHAVSCLLHYHSQRVSAVAFLAVGYLPPSAAGADPISAHAQITAAFGYDVFAYMRFFVQPDAATIIEKNMDSFISLLYPQTPQLWREYLCVDSGARAWIESGKTADLPAHMGPEDKKYLADSLLAGGMAAPLCWYKQLLEKTVSDEAEKISPEAAEVKQPLLFIAFNGDIVSLPAMGDASHKRCATGAVTRKEISGDHWGLQSHAEEVNAFLAEWLEGLN
ncbi:alpha/beta-hydrolase [Mycena vitilis]|nr:alpha/beta-hydrolase [Mycena vitilis]